MRVISEFELLWPEGPKLYQAEHFRVTTDSVLLGSFARQRSAKRGIDLGCGSGILSLILLASAPRLKMTGLEINPSAAALARENILINGFEERGTVICGDIRDYKSLFRSGEFDLAVSNPPYYSAGSGSLSPDPDRAAARGETLCSLPDLCSAMAYLLKTGGKAYLVYKPERLSELICLLSAAGLEPKRLRFVSSRQDAAPSLFLLEAHRGGNRGMSVLPPLILMDGRGEYSPELREIYHI